MHIGWYGKRSSRRLHALGCVLYLGDLELQPNEAYKV